MNFDVSYEREAPKARGIDGGGTIAGASPSGNVIAANITGTNQAGALAFDQWWFFSVIGDVAVDATYSLGTVTPLATRFSNAQVADFLAWNPAFVINANIVAASAAAVISTAQVQPARYTPYGKNAWDSQYMASYQTAADFQTTRGQFPLGEVIEGHTWLRMTSTIQATAATATIAFLFAPYRDRRADVPRAQPVAVRSISQ